jgi:hypothetical protein
MSLDLSHDTTNSILRIVAKPASSWSVAPEKLPGAVVYRQLDIASEQQEGKSNYGAWTWTNFASVFA